MTFTLIFVIRVHRHSPPHRPPRNLVPPRRPRKVQMSRVRQAVCAGVARKSGAAEAGAEAGAPRRIGVQRKLRYRWRWPALNRALLKASLVKHENLRLRP